jgi:intracellular septation protein
MKLLLDFFPLILFFVAFKLAGVYVATAIAIAASFVLIGYLRYKTGKTDPMQWLSLAVIVLFGGATLIFHNDTFIKWKPTVLYWLMAGTLFLGQTLFKKNLLKTLLGSQMEMPAHAWRVMNWSWVGFFAAMGAINLWVAFNFDTDTWVNFKLFGGMGLMFLFVIVQALYLSRFVKAES